MVTQNELRETIAANLRQLMDEQQWGVMELAQATDLTRDHIYKLLAAQTGVSLLTLAKLCDVFGMKLSEFLANVDDDPVELAQ